MKASVEFFDACNYLAAHVNKVLRSMNPGNKYGMCVLGTRVACEVLKKLGFEARPEAVDVTVANAVASRWAAEHGRLAEVGDQVGDAYMVIKTDRGDYGPAAWGGHLVTIACDGTRSLLIDSSLSDYSRRKHEIVLGGGLFDFDGEWPVCMKRKDGVTVWYEKISDERWKTSVDWTLLSDTVSYLVDGAIGHMMHLTELN